MSNQKKISSNFSLLILLFTHLQNFFIQIKIKEFKMAANARPKIVSEKPVEDQTKS